MTDEMFNDVGRFHEKFGLDNVTFDGPGPRQVSQELMTFRIKFLLEEIQEFMEATDYAVDQVQAIPNYSSIRLEPHAGDPERWDHEKMFDALLDLVYVAFGTAHLLGYPWQRGWDNIQAANMAKVRAQPDGSDSLRGSSYDVVKPEGWTAPDHKPLLANFGWEFPEDDTKKDFE